MQLRSGIRPTLVSTALNPLPMAMALGWKKSQANKQQGEDTDGKKLVGDGVLKTKTAGEGRSFVRVEQVT